MSEPNQSRSVRVDLEVRVTLPEGPEKLSRVVALASEGGGRVLGHLIYRIGNGFAVLLVCERPEEAALALGKGGFTVETETAVLVRTENSAGVLGNLLASLEVAGVAVGYGYATSDGETLLLVLRTADNPRAEDVLRRYLLPEA